MPDQPRSTPLNCTGANLDARLLYKLDAAAAQLSIGKTKLYGLMRTDQLPSVLLGGQRYIAHADLVEFVDKLRAEAPSFADTAP